MMPSCTADAALLPNTMWGATNEPAETIPVFLMNVLLSIKAFLIVYRRKFSVLNVISMGSYKAVRIMQGHLKPKIKYERREKPVRRKAALVQGCDNL
jgi:hypothetical protein